MNWQQRLAHHGGEAFTGLTFGMFGISWAQANEIMQFATLTVGFVSGLIGIGWHLWQWKNRDK